MNNGKQEMDEEWAHIMHEFFITIMRTRQNLRKRVQQHLEENGYEGITLEMTQVLFCLNALGGKANQQDIADRINKNKSSITSLVDNLAKRAMVTRTTDPADRRNNIIALSRKGNSFIDEFYPVVYQTYDVSKIPLSKDNMRHLIDTLNKIITL